MQNVASVTLSFCTMVRHFFLSYVCSPRILCCSFTPFPKDTIRGSSLLYTHPYMGSCPLRMPLTTQSPYKMRTQGEHFPIDQKFADDCQKLFASDMEGGGGEMFGDRQTVPLVHHVSQEKPDKRLYSTMQSTRLFSLFTIRITHTH